jgi:hypothetical protein
MRVDGNPGKFYKLAITVDFGTSVSVLQIKQEKYSIYRYSTKVKKLVLHLIIPKSTSFPSTGGAFLENLSSVGYSGSSL